jgi:putative peptidoglycan binding protein
MRTSILTLGLLGSVIEAKGAGPHPQYAYDRGYIVPAYYRIDQRQVRQVQIALRHQGYYAGAADGFLGYKTDRAISKFQLERCHPVRPLVDRWLLVTLGIARPVVD